ncbi:single-stranded DNA-binding protein [Alloprevotella rava]|uniref:Single-stranded DNA-binding protein n=2 Tax=Alloprevotella rava TaxID=671218 RepID=G5G919_9BACT|nr:single-stranded DNA-binding protein [Alloprevotella rava]EHG24804.1 hypothetical protein HMPREF9332_00069 [Alloprevotella rava F0323]MBB3703538.1 single-strand DNA-binding protein [Alloprevotella rava]
MSLNKAMLIGNVGKEPNIRYIDNGVCTAAFPLATTTPGYILPNGTQVPERTEWHNIMLWRKLAEVAEKYVHKGDKLYIEGEIRTRSYQDKKGTTRYITEIWGKDMQMLSPKPQVAPAPINTETDKREENATTSDKPSLPF